VQGSYRQIISSCLFLFILISISLTEGISQSKNKISSVGTPPLKVITKKEYNSHAQVWSVGQDTSGYIYIATTEDIVQFDGSEWRTIPNPALGTIRSICNCMNKTYIGLYNEIGVLLSDTLGGFRYKSLKTKIASRYQEFRDPYDVVCLDSAVVFRTYNALYSYNIPKDTVIVSPASSRFDFISQYQGKAYAWDRGEGLIEIQSDGTSRLAVVSSNPELRVKRLAAYNEDTAIVATSGGFYWLSNDSLTVAYNHRIHKILTQRLYSFIPLPGNYYAIGTLDKGVFIMDKHGQLIQAFNESNGLPSNIIYNLFLDNEKNLWIASNIGLTVVELYSAITYLDKRHGADGAFIHMEEHNGNIYAAGYKGVFYKPKESPWQSISGSPFQQIEGLSNTGWVFTKRDNDLLLGTKTGLVQLNDGQYETIHNTNQWWAVLALKDEKELIGNSRDEGYYFYTKQNNKWVTKWKIEGLDLFVDFMEQETDGSIWLTDSDLGVFRFALDEEKKELKWIKKYGLNEGLPDTLHNRVFRHSTGLKFVTAKGVYRYNRQTDRFERDTLFGDHLSGNYIFRFIEGPDGNVAFSADGDKGVLRNNQDGTYTKITAPLHKFRSVNAEYIWYPSRNDVYIANSSGILHIDPTMLRQDKSAFPTRIRSVSIIKDKDSVIYMGDVPIEIDDIQYEYNALRFEYGALTYEPEQTIEYQYRLLGFSDHWSEWTDERVREFTNLRNGDYKFQVRSKNINNAYGNVDSFAFSVLSPWYLTSWAYTLYVLLFAGFIWLIIRLNSLRLKRENLRLEGIIAERTHEISEQAEKIRELDRVKTRFFSNISHEFRTPLTLIQGPIESILSNRTRTLDAVKNSLSVASRNVNTLRNLIDEILEFNKMEIGSLEVEYVPTPVYDYFEELACNYEILAVEKGLNWHCNLNIDPKLNLSLPVKNIEKILHNLVSNAVKYTDESGTVQLVASYEKDHLILKVTDEGKGIPEDEIDKIFDRFYQTQHGKLSAHSSGIGLAYVKEITEVLGGKIEVSSTLTVGSTFTFSMPVKTAVSSAQPKETESHQDLGVDYSYPNNKILVTEDNDEMAGFILDTLGNQFEIMWAQNGQEALDKLVEFDADLIISDIMMPVMDGLELLSKLKSNERLKLKSVIMLTAKTSQEVKLEALSFGLDDYLTKPFSPDELEVRVKNLLKNQYERSEWLKQNNEENELDSIDPMIRELIDLIEQNIDNRNFGVLDLSHAAALSDRQLTRVVKKSTGFTPAVLIREVKLSKAKNYLEEKRFRSVAEVCYAIGFEKPSHFSKIYFERYGKRPSDYL
jgi:signal transduction histidine kinase/DNA-binding response OmpR family regulator/ligand-binding sensor domain-containing protein